MYGWGRKSRPNFGSWVYTELEAGRPTRVVKDQYCSPTLDSQLARMLLEVAERRTPGTIHLAGASKLSRYESAYGVFSMTLTSRLGKVEPTRDKTLSFRGWGSFDTRSRFDFSW